MPRNSDSRARDKAAELGYEVGQYEFGRDIAWLLVEILAVLFLALRFERTQNSVSDQYNIAFYLIPTLLIVVLAGLMAIFSFIFHLERIIGNSKTEYNDLRQSIGDEVADSVLELMSGEINGLEPMHRNDRIRLENALERLAKSVLHDGS